MSLTTSARPRIRVETTSRVRGLRLDWVLLLAVAGLLTAGALLVREYFAARGLAFVRTTGGRIAPKAGPSRKRFAALLRKAAGD